MAMRHLLSLVDFDRYQLDAVLSRTVVWRDGEGGHLSGRRRRVATVFDGPAFRTRLAFDSAIDGLGAHRVDLPLTLGEREPVADTAAILSSAVDAVVMRTPDHDALSELAAWAEVPVVNAMSREGHPCEVISEAFTVQQHHGRLDGLHVVFVGEDTNLCRSWCELTCADEMTVTQVCPPGWELPEQFLAGLRKHGQRGQVRTSHDLPATARNADVLYTDGWPRFTQQAGADRDAFAAIRIDQQVLDQCSPEAVLMHCMPVRRGDEVSAAAFEDPRSITLAAKRNLAPSHSAILEHVLTP